jgi:hypothetical protein
LALNGANSLYEYAGSPVERPVLVGVDNRGAQISNCGTELGGGEIRDYYNAISADGKRVFFTALHESRGSNATCATPPVDEVYVRLNGVETVSISEPLRAQCEECQFTEEAPSPPKQSAQFQGASENGSKVFFTTTQELLPSQTGKNLYEYDFTNPFRKRIVLISKGIAEPEVQGVARVSEDGSHVYFVAKAVLAQANREGNAPTAGQPNLYAFERDAAFPQGKMTFIATLSGENDAEDWAEQDSRPVQATPDGRFLVFASAADLTSYKEEDASTVTQIYEYDAEEEILVRVSIGQNGFNHNGNTAEDAAQVIRPEYALQGDSPATAESSLALSGDGAYVFFTSTNALTPSASKGATNVYEYRSTGSIATGTVYLVSDGRDFARNGTELLGTDASGGDVFLQSADPLAPADTNTSKDIFDARIFGGFAEPIALSRCEGDACQRPLSSPPPLGPAPGSLAASVGNQAATAQAPTVVKSSPNATPRRLTRAQMLAKALTACTKQPKAKRAACRARAERKYGTKRMARKKGHHRGTSR